MPYLFILLRRLTAIILLQVSELFRRLLMIVEVAKRSAVEPKRRNGRSIKKTTAGIYKKIKFLKHLVNKDSFYDYS